MTEERLWVAFKSDEEKMTTHTELCFEDKCTGFTTCKWKAPNKAEQEQRQKGRKPGLSHYMSEDDHEEGKTHLVRIGYWDHGFIWRLDAPFDLDTYRFYVVRGFGLEHLSRIVHMTLALREKLSSLLSKDGRQTHNQEHRELTAKKSYSSVDPSSRWCGWKCTPDSTPDQPRHCTGMHIIQDDIKTTCSCFTVMMLQLIHIGATESDRDELKKLVACLVKPDYVLTFVQGHPDTFELEQNKEDIHKMTAK